MNAQDYISSGLLEAYVLGSLSEAESEQVAGAVCRFPEVALEVTALEGILLRAAEQDAVAPPPDMEERIWAAIEASELAQTPPAQAPAPAQAPKAEPVIMPFPATRRDRTSWARAAVWVALAGSAALNMILWSGRSAERQQAALAQQQLETARQQQQFLTADLERYSREAEMAAQPGMQQIAMTSLQPGHPMAAVMYWNKEKSEAHVSVKKLPPPPVGMQYQLWAIADGKPVSLGMLDNEVVARQGMQKLSQAVAAGQAFAVSLEKAGGNPAPTPDKIYLMGKLPA